MTLAAAVLLSCLVLDTPAKVEGWLRRLGMEPAVAAYSNRFRREATVYRERDGDHYAIVLPAGGRACVVDMGHGWRRLRRRSASEPRGRSARRSGRARGGATA